MAYTSNSIISNNTVINNAEGIWLRHCTNNTIIKNYISNIGEGIFLGGFSENNTIAENNIIYNWAGLSIYESATNNLIYGNTIAGNLEGVEFGAASGNKFYHNNFKENIYQTSFTFDEYPQVWDDGYPSGGNYWSNYLGADANGDTIGDTPHYVAANNTDHYPLIAPITVFNVGTWNNETFYVEVISPSNVTNFDFSPANKTLSFDVEGTNGTLGFCRVTIPLGLMWCDDRNQWAVKVDGELVQRNVTETTRTFIYFTYAHSKKRVEITSTHATSEFYPSTIALPLTIAATLLAIVVALKKKRFVRQIQPR
ncbi:MAG: NosD domain-containing protein [Candidatus Bathyarchaeia archaeon]|jgi:parallel beta-helix repeat protein|nr:hypothetical protein [Candidatus Bathyarchaeota archaeon A05DMB-4]MDH7594987.1 NosD domain-containing protein [Candidatus Bathyarchaeota archaeon]